MQKVNVLELEHRESNDSDDSWLNTIENPKEKEKISALMMVNDCEIRFQLDSGADVNTIQKKYVRKVQIQNCSKTLRMFNKSSLKPLGETTLSLKNVKTGQKNEITFVIVPNSFQSLLGLKTIQKLGLITVNQDQFIAKIESSMDRGDLGEANLTVDPTVKPKVLPFRKIPIALKDRVKADLDKLVERGILIPVTKPTAWVSQKAVVQKPNGKLRICLDPQLLNVALQRDHYNFPTFDDVFPNLKNARLFSKLDVLEAFWHVRLDEQSSLLTTMITPCGRYRWARLPFGLSGSREIFQRKLNETLEGLEGTFTIADHHCRPRKN